MFIVQARNLTYTTYTIDLCHAAVTVNKTTMESPGLGVENLFKITYKIK